MGFLEEVKVNLSSTHADRSHNAQSDCSWTLKDDVSPPNPNYKIKVNVPNINIPSSFQKIGPDRGNDKLTFVYSNGSQNLDIANDMLNGRYITITIDALETADIGQFVSGLRRCMWNQMQNRNVVTNGIQSFTHKPWPIIDTDEITGVPTLTFAITNWNNTSGRNDTENIAGQGGMNGKTQTTVAPVTSTEVTFKILTQADIPSIPASVGIKDSDIRLANVCGFSKTETYPEFKFLTANDPYQVIGTVGTFSTVYSDTAWGGCVRASRRPDLLGTKFIKVMTNLPISNIDPTDKTFRRILGVIPVTDSDQQTEMSYLSGELQNPQYNTLAQSKLDTIHLYLLDDHNNPLKPYSDWYCELSVMFEEPIALDAYRGISSIIGNPSAVEFGASARPEVYMRMQNELKRVFEDTLDTENENRDYQTGRIRAR